MGSVHSSTFPGEFSTKNIPNKNSLLRPLVCTQKGPVQGKQLKLKDGRIVNIFLGIPFAKPPIGPLRFKVQNLEGKKPEEPEPWGPIPLQARRYKARAIQRDFIWDSVELGGVPKSEDCLYLNVVSPGWSAPSNLPGGWPVMVFIHGGGFMMDSAVKYHYSKLAQNLTRHGVIVVTMNYRLGLLGFFSTGDSQCPGNLGLWDQLFALRWVRQNIAAFGGNPNRITLFGHSAGAASADLLSLSPLSRDLFHQVILMGGSAETIWAVSSKEVLVEYCRKKAIQLGFRPKEGNAEWGREENGRMMEFLRNLPATKFDLTLLGDRTIIDEIRLAVSPVIDAELLPKSPKELRQEITAPKPMICGQCQHEGLLFLALGMRRANGKFLAYCEQRLVEILKEAKRRIVAEKMDENLVPTLEEINELYGIEKQNMLVATKQRACVTIMSDLVNNLAMHNLSRLTLAKPNPPRVWRFILEHFNADSTIALNPLFPFKGSTHGNELHYIFGINFFVVPWRRKKADKAVLEMMTKFWTNFAKFGDPNGPTNGNVGEGMVRWEPSTPENVERHLNILAWDSAMREENENSQRVRKLGEVYRALVQ